MVLFKSTSGTYPLFKATIVALLLCNAALYAVANRTSSALDSFAWLVLLVLFELETDFEELLQGKNAIPAIHVIRTTAVAGVIAATMAYTFEESWLDIINSALWIAVVVMLEFEMRFPHIVAWFPKAFLTLATALYAGLTLLVPLWAWRGEWLDAYDAILWITAFAAIELDVLRFSRRAVTIR